jgi:muramoyltetrapeptide carboxypeptidase LdcA involved in peptidoglycan recycling
MTKDLLLYILEKFPILKKIPVMYDLNFGHTQPILTFPIGKRQPLMLVKERSEFKASDVK